MSDGHKQRKEHTKKTAHNHLHSWAHAKQFARYFFVSSFMVHKARHKQHQYNKRFSEKNCEISKKRSTIFYIQLLNNLFCLFFIAFPFWPFVFLPLLVLCCNIFTQYGVIQSNQSKLYWRMSLLKIWRAGTLFKWNGGSIFGENDEMIKWCERNVKKNAKGIF